MTTTSTDITEGLTAALAATSIDSTMPVLDYHNGGGQMELRKRTRYVMKPDPSATKMSAVSKVTSGNADDHPNAFTTTLVNKLLLGCFPEHDTLHVKYLCNLIYLSSLSV